MLDLVADEARAVFGVTDGHGDAAEARSDQCAAGQVTESECQPRRDEQTDTGAVRLQAETEDVLEISQAVVAPEAHLVAEEGEHQGIGQCLGDDREIHPGDP